MEPQVKSPKESKAEILQKIEETIWYRDDQTGKNDVNPKKHSEAIPYLEGLKDYVSNLNENGRIFKIYSKIGYVHEKDRNKFEVKIKRYGYSQSLKYDDPSAFISNIANFLSERFICPYPDKFTYGEDYKNCGEYKNNCGIREECRIKGNTIIEL